MSSAKAALHSAPLPSPLRCQRCTAGERWLCCCMELITAGSKADYRLRPEAAHPENHCPRRTWVKERPIPRKRTTAFAPPGPAVTASMAPLTTRAPIESKLAPCASSARHLRSAPLAPLTQPGKAPMTLSLRHGSLPASVSRKQRERSWPPQSYFKSSNCEKNARSFHFQKIPAPAHRQAAS